MKNCLVVGPAWIGDMVMAQVLFKLLKAQNPNVAIDVLAPEWTFPLLSRMPEVRKAIVSPFKHQEVALGKRIALGQSLKDQYDHAILCPNSLKSALVPFFAGIPTRTGWRGEFRYGLLNDVRVLDKARYPLMIERFAALAFPNKFDLKSIEPLPFPKLRIDSRKRDEAIAQYSVNLDKPILLLCPGAEFGPSKRWPEAYYSSVAEHYIKQGWQIWIMGSQKDTEVSQKILASLSDKNAVIDFCGKTKLCEAIDLMSCVTKVLTNDSGLMHIAAALDKPLVAVYGSSTFDFTPPLNDKAKTVVSNEPCRPCFKRTCPLGHHACMTKLKPDLVIESLEMGD